MMKKAVFKASCVTGFIGLSSFLGAAPSHAASLHQFTGVPGATGHYYQYFSAELSWEQAKDAASGLIYKGLQGYLATITSQAEQDFIVQNVSDKGWIGASDVETEGTWKWVTGPEAGQVFWQGNAALGYANWDPGEPNNLGSAGEDYAHLRANKGGRWNDLPLSNGLIPARGYIVEFGGLKAAEVPTPALLPGLVAVGAAALRKRNEQSAESAD